MNDVTGGAVLGAAETAAPKPALLMLVGLAAIGPMAQSILIPSLPGLQHVFDTDYATVQLVLTLSLVSVALAQLVYGPVSDRFGRRPALLGGGALFLVGSTAAMLAPSIGFLIGSRVLQAAGGCAGIVLASAILRDVYRREEVAGRLAYVTMGMVMAPMIAPTIGGFLEVWVGWWSSFALVALIGGAILVAALVTFRETNRLLQPTTNPLTTMRTFGALLRVPDFRGYAATSAFSLAVFFGFLAGAPYVVIEVMGVAPSTYGLYFIVISAAFMAGNFLAGRYSRRVGIDRMIWLGTSLSLVSGAAMFALSLAGQAGIAVLFGATAVMAFGNGFAMPNASAGAVSVRPQAAGTAAGLNGFLQMTMAAGASFLVGTLIRDSALPLTAVMLAGAWLAFLAHAYGVWHRRRATVVA